MGQGYEQTTSWKQREGLLTMGGTWGRIRVWAQEEMVRDAEGGARGTALGEQPWAPRCVLEDEMLPGDARSGVSRSPHRSDAGHV